ncbi:MAG: M6 family metalloprotease domain-containing protein [Bacteroidia bacterium]
MTKFFTLFLAIVAFTINAKAQHVSNCAASPYPVEVKQPDGTVLTVIGKGNMALPYTETVDGYTVVKAQNGFYHYAERNEDGMLEPSGIAATDAPARNIEAEKFLTSQTKNLRLSSEKAAEVWQQEEGPSMAPHDHDHEDEPDNSFPSTGSRKILLLLIEYPDLPATYDASGFDDLMNKENFNGTGSFRDYYLQISQNELDLSVDVMGWYMAKNDHSHYARNNPDYNNNVRALVAEAVDSAEAEGVDFSEYDNDGDGEVDGVFIVHSGQGAEEGSQLDYVWSHRWSLNGSNRRTYDGVKIRDYVINPETRVSGGKRMTGIGVFCHEFGHLLQLPDLYDTDNSSKGIGRWCLMAGGSWLNKEKTPAMMSAWCRERLGWIEPEVISANGAYMLDPASSSHTSYKILTSDPDEYFLLENRQKRDYDGALPGSGLAIWHINNVKASLYPGSNTVNTDENFKGIDLEEADGGDDLDNDRNSGDAGDLFPGTSGNTSFTTTTFPNSNFYSGESSGVTIVNIEELTDSTIIFFVGQKPNANFTIPANNYCTGEEVTFTNLSQFSDGFIWDFGDGNTDTARDLSYTFTQGGSYYIKLKAFNAEGFENTDSVLVHIYDIPVAEFSASANGLAITVEYTGDHGTDFTWDFGDGTSPRVTNLKKYTYTYDSTGFYTIQLTVRNQGGCSANGGKGISAFHVGIDEFTDVTDITTAWPNPVSETLNVRYNMGVAGNVKLELINMTGQVVYSRNTSRASGQHTESLHLNSQQVQPGIYLLRIEANGERKMLKINKRN